MAHPSSQNLAPATGSEGSSYGPESSWRGTERSFTGWRAGWRAISRPDRRADWAALALSLLAVVCTFLVADRVFSQAPHIEDEMAYVWQARVIAGGKWTTPIPPEPHSFLAPFVVDYNGHRFGKYPLGWPALLAVGEFFGMRVWVNSLLAGLGVWLTYRLGRRIFNPGVGLLAAALTVTSPFFLINSGSLLSHPLGLALSAGFALAWLNAFGPSQTYPPAPFRAPERAKREGGEDGASAQYGTLQIAGTDHHVIASEALRAKQSFWRAWLYTLLAAGCLGWLVLSRPMTAVAVAAPFALHGLVLLARGDWALRRRLLVFVLVAAGLAALHFAWQWAMTGDATLNPYTLWWEYDKIGFGPGIGRSKTGHTLRQAWINTRASLKVGYRDLFGWGSYSWIFLPFGLPALYRRPRRVNWAGLLLAGVVVSLVTAYLAYWVGSELFGPRYYYEALFSLAILSAAGVFWLAGLPLAPGEALRLGKRQAGLENDQARLETRLARLRLGLVGLLLAGLVGYNLTTFLPARLAEMKDLYGISRADIAPFLTAEAQALTPALIIVHPTPKWTEYGALLDLQSPFLDSPFIFVHSRGQEADLLVAAFFPDRRVFHYYTDEPGVFHRQARE